MLPLETNTDVMDNALFTSLNVDRIHKMKVSKFLAFAELMGYCKKQVLNVKPIRDKAMRELAYRIKLN